MKRTVLSEGLEMLVMVGKLEDKVRGILLPERIFCKSGLDGLDF